MEVRHNPTTDNSSVPQYQRRALSPSPSKQPKASPTPVDTSSVSLRLQKELMSLMMSGGDLGVSAFPEGDSIFTWIGTIEGGKGTIYEGLSYKLSLHFSLDYPFKPPQVKFETMCFHPNVDQYGNICLDILQDKWSSAYDCRTILLSIQSLLGEPNIESPLNSYAATLWKNEEAPGSFFLCTPVLQNYQENSRQQQAVGSCTVLVAIAAILRITDGTHRLCLGSPFLICSHCFLVEGLTFLKRFGNMKAVAPSNINELFWYFLAGYLKMVRKQYFSGQAIESQD